MALTEPLLLSIRTEHAERIFAGTKTIELRRVRPRVDQGSSVLIYVPSPVMALVGGFEVERVVCGTPIKLWRDWKDYCGISRSRFMSYFQGVDVAYGIVVRRAWRVERPCLLTELRERIPGFTPPQSYWYLKSQYVDSLPAEIQFAL